MSRLIPAKQGRGKADRPGMVKRSGRVYKAAMPNLPSHSKWPALHGVLSSMRGVAVAVSGGVDSMLLATLAHRALPGRAVMVHAVSPAVPAACTDRVNAHAASQGWDLKTVESGEFADERYLANPFDRCYFCKSNLYALLGSLASELEAKWGFAPAMASGTNTGDLGEHRPGLDAARESGVRHPFVEAGVAKEDIRAMALELSLDFAFIPASPCLASRVYTGTRVTPDVLAAVAFAEEELKRRLNVSVLRCRVRGREMLVEMLSGERSLAAPAVLQGLERAVRERFPSINSLSLDPDGYRPGRAFRRDPS
jgi:uncharacterized protein